MQFWHWVNIFFNYYNMMKYVLIWWNACLYDFKKSARSYTGPKSFEIMSISYIILMPIRHVQIVIDHVMVHTSSRRLNLFWSSCSVTLPPHHMANPSYIASIRIPHPKSQTHYWHPTRSCLYLCKPIACVSTHTTWRSPALMKVTLPNPSP